MGEPGESRAGTRCTTVGVSRRIRDADAVCMVVLMLMLLLRFAACVCVCYTYYIPMLNT